MSESDAPFPDAITVSEAGATLDLDRLLTGRGFVTGKSGSGKSNTAAVVAEELLDLGLSLLIVDTDGEYHGLTEAYDVRHAGAGPDCDVDLAECDPATLAEDAVAEGVPTILDVSGFVDPERSAAAVEAVLREVFALEADLRTPFLVFVEEIHEYLPQQGGLDDLGTLLLQIAKRGRKRGLGLCGLSQRPAAVDKEFVTQCDWFAWHRLTWESDVDVVRRFLDADHASQIGDLAAGEAFVVTDWDEAVRRVQFRRRHTPDAGATPSLSDLPERERTTRSRTGVDRDSAPDADPTESAEAEGDEPMGTETRDSLVVEGAELLAYVLRRVAGALRRAGAALRERGN